MTGYLDETKGEASLALSGRLAMIRAVRWVSMLLAFEPYSSSPADLVEVKDLDEGFQLREN